MYKIRLSNGVEIGNLTLNGNNYVSYDVIPDSVFDGMLSPATIINCDDNSSTIVNDGYLVSNTIDCGKSWIVIAEKTQEQKLRDMIDSINMAENDFVSDRLGNKYQQRIDDGKIVLEKIENADGSLCISLGG